MRDIRHWLHAAAVTAALSSAGSAQAMDLSGSDWSDLSAQVTLGSATLPIFSRPALERLQPDVSGATPLDGETDAFGKLNAFEAAMQPDPKGIMARAEIYPGTELGAVVGKGLAAWYKHSGRTASGEIFDPNGLSAAHATLPLGTRVRVVNMRNAKEIVVTVNDRMTTRPSIRRRFAIELSKGGAAALGIDGIAPVEIHKIDDVKSASN